MQTAHEECERKGGHWYQVDGFSQITHPEVYFGDLPKERDLNKVVFRAYVCRECGRRVSVEEGREYMRNKPLSEEEAARRREQLLNETVPNWRDYTL